MQKTKPLFLKLKNLSLIVLGTLLLSFAAAVFILPFNLISGGVASIAIILRGIPYFQSLSNEIIIMGVTWLFFFSGLIFLGKDFALKTFISTAIYPLGVWFFSALLSPHFLGGFFNIQNSDIAVILAVIFGGATAGMGCALTFLGGGSTGGVDVIALILCKFFKKLKSSVAIFIIDAVVIICGAFVLKDLAAILLGILTAFIFATVLDRVFLGQSKSFTAQVISQHPEEINAAVIKTLGRTTTQLTVTGGFSKKEKKMLLVSFTIREYAELISIINTCDPSAFITVLRSYEISGEGWTK